VRRGRKAEAHAGVDCELAGERDQIAARSAKAVHEHQHGSSAAAFAIGATTQHDLEVRDS
jgi:hypothetical protein